MVFFSQGLSDQAKTFTGKESTPAPQKINALTWYSTFFSLQILVMAHPWSKNLQKLSWPQKNSMALQRVLPSMGLASFLQYSFIYSMLQRVPVFIILWQSEPTFIHFFVSIYWAPSLSTFKCGVLSPICAPRPWGSLRLKCSSSFLPQGR